MGGVTVVTGFIPLPGHPRPENEYRRLARQWIDPIAKAGFGVYPGNGTVLKTALREFVNAMTVPKVGDNLDKNTVDYHCVQHQKFVWLYEAYAKTAVHPSTYVWMDYGILHVPGVTVDIIMAYLRRLHEHPRMDISIPGCWDDTYMPRSLDSEYPVWRFCGGLMAVPAMLIPQFCVSAMTVASFQMKKTRRAEWEVNTLARLEKTALLPIHWYQADHNETMFTEGP